MSPHQPRHSQRGDKGEASAKNAASKVKNETPMERFKSLTRSILTVSNTEVKAEQARLEKAKAKREK